MDRRNAIALGAGAGLGGLLPARPDQQYFPARGAAVVPGARSGILRARLVEIFGTGPNTGLFVYSGTPALGNPPIFNVVAPGVTSDPFGNTVKPVMSAGTTNNHTTIDANGNLQIFGGGAIDIVLNPSKKAMFFYSPSQGAGNLVYSISPTSGTDAVGNAYLPGATSYVKITSTDFQATQHASGGISWWSATSNAGPWNLNSFLQQQADEVGVSFGSNINGNSITVGEAAAALQVFGAPLGIQVVSGGINWTGGAVGDFLQLARSTNGTGGLFIATQQQAAPTGTGIIFRGQAATDRLFGVDVVGDTSRRLTITPGGTLAMGSGAAAPDTQMYRSAPGAFAADFMAWDNSGTPETWNAVTFANGWVNSGTGPGLQYRFTVVDSNVQITGRITAPVGIAGGQAVIVALPAIYRPTHTQQLIAVNITAGGTTRFQLGTGGVITFQQGAVNGDVVEIISGNIVAVNA